MNPIVLITGASGAIGAAAARCFADHGYAVALQYRTHAFAAQQTTAAFPSGTPHLCVYCDLNSACSVAEMRKEVYARLGKISVLVNCAGTALPQTLLTDTTDADYDTVFETNVNGVIRATKAFANDLRQNRGAIVNLSSIWGVVGGSCEALYTASKAAVIGLTKALAKELGPSGIRVNCVAPGWIESPMNAHLSDEARKAFAADTPLGRIGKPEEVAEAIRFLQEGGLEP